jgi:hypothetical protein
MMCRTLIRQAAYLTAVALVPAAMGAQTPDSVRPAVTQPAVGPPIRRIATASALSTEQIGSITGVRELPDGRILLNDGTRRRLLLMDTTLRTVEVVLDSLTEVANTYGVRPGALIAYRGDSTLFIDQASYAMLVLDPQGKVARVRSVPRVQDVQYLTNSSGQWGWPGVDAQGRLVYRLPAQAAPPKVRPPAGVPYIPVEPDSVFVVAMDPDTRKIDTLGTLRVPKQSYSVRVSPGGGFNMYSIMNPLPSADDWAILPDGTVAFVRAIDYRVEYRHPDGTITSSAKLPFEWQRLTDADKVRIVDSVKAEQRRSSMTSYVSSMIRWVNQFRKSYPPNFTVPEGTRVPQALQRGWVLPPGMSFPPNYIYGCAPGEEPKVTPPDSTPAGGPSRGGPPGALSGTPSCIPGPVMIIGGTAPPPPTLREANVVPPNELPNYRPPLANSGAVRADADGSLWIRPVPAVPNRGGAVYDIVSRAGELVDRLQLPPGYTIVGFGKGRVVYLSMRDANGTHLARVRLK